jgi:hypothetical protein
MVVVTSWIGVCLALWRHVFRASAG